MTDQRRKGLLGHWFSRAQTCCQWTLGSAFSTESRHRPRRIFTWDHFWHSCLHLHSNTGTQMKLHTVLVILALVDMVNATCFNRDRPCGLHSPHLLKFTVQFLSLPLAKSKKSSHTQQQEVEEKVKQYLWYKTQTMENISWACEKLEARKMTWGWMWNLQFWATTSYRLCKP